MVEGLKEFDEDKGIILTKNYADTKEVDGKIIECIPLWAWLISNGRVFFNETSAGTMH
jgi:predicted AAA+ superfamily ATPase